jgi:multicomponent Na+:H+ antiporter subunit A
MLVLLGLHLVLALLAPRGGAGSGGGSSCSSPWRPAATAVWAATRAGQVLDGRPVASTTAWVPGLGLTLDLRLDALALLLVTLVAGVGTLVFLYCARYFARSSRAWAGSPACSPAFAGAMLGLVLADDLILLYVFWELTSVTSYLLIGFDDESEDSRRAAQQALLVTTLGGLVMLVGLILLGQAAGTSSLSAILADPPRGGTVALALVLILVGAFTKSAQVPFHPWLPRRWPPPRRCRPTCTPRRW